MQCNDSASGQVMNSPGASRLLYAYLCSCSLCNYCPCKVLADWRGQNTARGRLSADAKAHWDAKVREFLGAGRGKFKLRSLKQIRLANKHHLQAIDHALRQGAKLPLSSFVAAKPCQPLASHERRFWVSVDSLPAAILAASKDRVRRSCIEDTTTKRTRLEVSWNSVRQVLHSWLDQGVVGWHSQPWLYCDKRVRGFFWCDPSHRRWDNTLNSINRADLGWMKDEVMLAMSSSSGPWEGAANYQSMRECIHEYTSNYDVSDPLYQALYERIAFDWRSGQGGMAVGSDEDQADVFSQFEDMATFNCKGERTQSGRWFQFIRRFRSFKKCWSAMLLACLYMSIISNWHQSLCECPLFASIGVRFGSAKSSVFPKGHVGAPAAASTSEPSGSAGGAAASTDSSKQPVAQSNKHLDEVRRSCKNTMHLTCQILAKSSTRSCMIGVESITAALEKEFGCTSIDTSTQKGCLEWRTSMAGGLRVDHVVNMLQAMNDSHVLVEMGMVQCGAWRDCLLSKADGEAIMGHLSVFLREMLAHEIMYLRVYSHWLPGKFAALVSHDSAVRSDALRFCEDVWTTICDAEAAAAANDDVFLRTFLRDQLWTWSTWPREVLIGLAECRFQRVPSDLQDELCDSFGSMVGTVEIENSFNLIRRKARHHIANKLGTISSFVDCVNGDVLPDTDKPPVKVPPIQAEQIDDETFGDMFHAKITMTFLLVGMRL